MEGVLKIDNSEYKAIESLDYYGDLLILETGSLRPIHPIPDEFKRFLKMLRSDISLWDGSKGELGIPFDGTCILLPKTFSPIELHDLREKYMKVKTQATCNTTHEKLKIDLQTKENLLGKVTESVLSIEEDMSNVFEARDRVEVQMGEESEQYQTLSRKISMLTEEIKPLRRAHAQLKKEAQQVRVQIGENETGYMRKLAILRTVFSLGTDENVISNYTIDTKAAIEAVRIAENACSSSFIRLQAKRFYIDVKTGLQHLYTLEDILKNILQNLQAGMKSMSSSVDRIYPGESETGVEFRLSYVRKMWNRADSAFKAALPYIENTSLPQVREQQEKTVEEGTSEQKRKSSKGSLVGGKKFGIYESIPIVLPNFMRIELSHPIRRKSKIVSLHKNAARSYREVNTLYDWHDRLTKEALANLQERERMEHRANILLIEALEKFLQVS